MLIRSLKFHVCLVFPEVNTRAASNIKKECDLNWLVFVIRGKFQQYVYTKLLRSQMPKAQKTVKFLCFWVKAARKTLAKLTPVDRFLKYRVTKKLL